MWLVRLALNRPYTFIVLALLILLLSPAVILRTPMDIFPNINSEGLRVGVVRNSHAALLPITIGQDYGDAVEVLSGLTAQDAVIVNPSDSLANGARVEVENEATNGVRQ
jgi:multidrug efflux pump subunit AcrA (membrane-fusion protein)